MTRYKNKKRTGTHKQTKTKIKKNKKKKQGTSNTIVIKYTAESDTKILAQVLNRGVKGGWHSMKSLAGQDQCYIYQGELEMVAIFPKTY